LADGMLDVRCGTTARAPATVLLVEDDDEMRDLIGDTLRRDGYLVLAAPSAYAALQILELRSSHGAKRIDLVLSDICMDGLSGLDLGRRLRQGSPTVPLIFMTAFPDPALHLAAASLDATVLSKPFCLDALRRAVLTTIAAKVKREALV
jgi:CheY-like chemotaxis protein